MGRPRLCWESSFTALLTPLTQSLAVRVDGGGTLGAGGPGGVGSGRGRAAMAASPRCRMDGVFCGPVDEVWDAAELLAGADMLDGREGGDDPWLSATDMLDEREGGAASAGRGGRGLFTRSTPPETLASAALDNLPFLETSR
jgi:hypothetical protein